MSKTPCIHLEKELSDNREEPLFEDMFRRSWQSLDNTSAEREDLSSEELPFRLKLIEHNLSPAAIDILVLKYVYDLSFADIVEEMGNVSVGTVWKVHNDAIKVLRRALKE